ncbi:uncharacterized protein FA14DRAFT_157938 [Meira miltonrushii]|uniref:Uncharacterized protein n=1 Tax=Meira miltonrushii TaxID=1280837 RepID=A0A316V3H5_9BASI|nr:uncharacterized protein FA14DRAFT_157938 [Meira miltonrushii]PWN32002.1 hypothetical protein FA14DRAFT_157938 [Meira miltonrushii]
MQLGIICFVWYGFVLLSKINHAMLHSPSHSDSSIEFDWMSFLDIPEDPNVKSSHTSADPQHSIKEVKEKEASVKNKKELGEIKRRERRKDLQRIYHQNSKNKFHNLPESEKAKIRQSRKENQRRHCKKLKELTGFSTRREEKIGQARLAKELGTLTEEQKQLLQKEYNRKRKYNETKKNRKVASVSTEEQEKSGSNKKRKVQTPGHP